MNDRIRECHEFMLTHVDSVRMLSRGGFLINLMIGFNAIHLYVWLDGTVTYSGDIRRIYGKWDITEIEAAARAIAAKAKLTQ